MTSSNRTPTDHGVPPELGALLAALADDRAPLDGILAHAMVYSQDADRKLERARVMKREATKYRAEAQRQTIEQTEAFCIEARERAEEEQEAAGRLRIQARERAEEEQEAARKLRAQAQEAWETARSELDRAVEVRAEAEAYLDSVRAEAEELRRSVAAQAESDAEAFRKQVAAEANAAIARKKEEVDHTVRRALGAIEKMESAVQDELEAQQMYTEGLRFRTASPAWDGSEAEATPESGTEATPESEAEATPESGTEATPESEAEATPESGTEATPESGTEATLESGTEAMPEPGTEATPEPEAQPEAEAKAEAAPDAPPPKGQRTARRPAG